MNVPMQVILRPPPKTVTVKAPPRFGSAPYLRGYGALDFICGSCGHLLAEGMLSDAHIAIFVLQCPCCGSLNRPPNPDLDAETILVRRRRAPALHQPGAARSVEPHDTSP